MARRTKEEIERHEKMRKSCIENTVKVISDNWDDMRDAEGPIHLTLTFTGNDAQIDMRLSRKVEAHTSFKLDDGQHDLTL